jgi:hypothetical protein
MFLVLSLMVFLLKIEEQEGRKCSALVGSGEEAGTGGRGKVVRKW